MQDRGDAPSVADRIPNVTGTTIPHDLWLEHASRFPVEKLAERDGVEAKTIKDRTRKAIRVIAKREGQAEEDVMLEFYKKQLANGVIRDRAELVKVANKAAAQRLASNPEWRRQPHSMLDRHPCAFADGFCIGHNFCAERDLRSPVAASSQAKSPLNQRIPFNNATQQNLTQQSFPLQFATTGRQLARDPRMNVDYILNYTKLTHASDSSCTILTAKAESPKTLAPSTLPSLTPGNRFEDDTSERIGAKDRMQVGLPNSPSLDLGPPRVKPLLRYKDRGILRIKVNPDWEEAQSYGQGQGTLEDPLVIDD